MTVSTPWTHAILGPSAVRLYARKQIIRSEISMSRCAALHSDFRKARTFASLDGLRCLCILAVIFHHSRGPLHLGRISDRGFLGVDLFFVISGFLIATLLIRERERSGTISLKRFAVRRALRIFPLYFVVVAALAVLYGVLHTDSAQSSTFFDELPQVLTYTTNWIPATTILGVSWSLAAEEQFYVVWPPIQKYSRNPLCFVIALLILSQVVNLGFLDDLLHSCTGWESHEPPMLREATFTPILLGVLLAHLLHSKAHFARIARVTGYSCSPVIIIIIVAVLLELLPLDLSGWPRLLVHLVMMFLVASCVVREDHWLSVFCRWRPVARIGILSYGLYLLHLFALDPVTRLVERGNVHPILLFPLTLGGSILLAELSYRFLESRFLHLKKRFA
jgi:peptidoglycan/LPS O-acetylase OafA/YrhL